MSDKPLDRDLFEIDDTVEESVDIEWRGMPEFHQPDNMPFRQIIISFESQEDVDNFAKLLDANITKKTKSLWFPYREKNNIADLFYISEDEDGS